MNIFVTDPCPIKSAAALDDKRVNKMLLESAQMLATALVQYDAPLEFMPITKAGNPYKVSHLNHPCSVWVRQTKANYLWLVRHARQLSIEYTASYDKTHWVTQFLDRIEAGISYLPDGDLQPFVNCSLFKEGNTIEQYRRTMLSKWQEDKRPATWKNRTQPTWSI